MPRSLDLLPAGKRAELSFVAEVLMAGFDEESPTCCAQHLKPPYLLKAAPA